MNARHLVVIVAVGSGLIFLAPTPEKAGQADKVETVSEPVEDITIIPAAEENSDQVKLEPATFTGDTRMLEDSDQ